MPRFLDTRGYSTIAIAICDRCRMKRPHSDLQKDPNFPGLKVCSYGCKDEYDPYRLPARKTERITLQVPRPDTSIAVTANDLTTTGYGGYVVSPQQNSGIVQNDGNLDGILVTPTPNG